MTRLPATISFPSHCTTIGKKVAYLSSDVMRARQFDLYVALMSELLADQVHYVDPVHEYHSKSEVLAMLAKYVPRAANDKFEFSLVYDGEDKVIWRWKLALKIRFSPFEFIINGLVHAGVTGGKIVYQREYYDPMESIGVIPVVGRLYKLILQMG